AQWNFLPIPFGQTICFDVLPSIFSKDVLQQCDGRVGMAARLLLQSVQEAIVQQLKLEIP
ncbi:MAG: hypothetical protein ACKO18_00410, partial [Bacteroidota bacterium]